MSELAVPRIECIGVEGSGFNFGPSDDRAIPLSAPARGILIPPLEGMCSLGGPMLPALVGRGMLKLEDDPNIDLSTLPF